MKKDQRPDDWARMVISWIAQAEAEMEEAHRADDGRAYIAAARRRDEMRQAILVIDPSAPLRFVMKALSRGFVDLRRAMERAATATAAVAVASRKTDPDA